MRRNNARLPNGNTIVEFGPALYIVFLVITAPLIAFGSFAARYVALANAANLACQQASKARTFKTDIPAGSGSPAHYSAVTTAKTVATLALTQYGGGYVNLSTAVNPPVNVYVKVQPNNTSTPTPTQPGANQVLSANLMNPTLYSYTCEVTVAGTISPIFPSWSAIPGISIPMLNAPLALTTRADYAFENTLNLSI